MKLMPGQGVRGKEPFIGDGLQAFDLGRAYEKHWQGYRCVFVLSTGRVGSKTLAVLYNLSTSVMALHEPMPRLIQASFEAYMEPDRHTPVTWRSMIHAARDDYICKAYDLNWCYVETSNRMTWLASHLAESFPDSRFIHLHRHPLEVIRSGLRRSYYQGHGGDFARVRPRADDEWVTAWDGFAAWQKVAWYWQAANSEALNFKATLPADRFLSVAAADMFAGSEACIRSLFEFAGTAVPSWRKIKRVLGKKLNAQQGAPDDDGWRPEQLTGIRNIAGETAAGLGYDI